MNILTHKLFILNFCTSREEFHKLSYIAKLNFRFLFCYSLRIKIDKFNFKNIY